MSKTYGTRSRVIPVRLSDAEWTLVQQRSTTAGLKPSEYIRACAIGNQDSDALAAAHAITNHLAGLESAIKQARRALGQEE